MQDSRGPFGLRGGSFFMGGLNFEEVKALFGKIHLQRAVTPFSENNMVNTVK